jgi:glucokinase
MTIVAADIGGTYARFGTVENGALGDLKKFEAAQFPGLAQALEAYGHTEGTLLLAAAANKDAQGRLRFHNKNSWIIDTALLKGWKVALQVGDFPASAHGISVMPAEKRLILRPGRERPECPRAVLGPGTGLGLAYIAPDGRVQETHGGHMAGACITDEQHMVAKIVRRLRGGEGVFIPEDAVSGRGLPVLYRAVCAMHGQTPEFSSAEDMLALSGDRMAGTTLRLFHEFFGLFAHNAAVAGNAYGGLYLEGGLPRRLHEAGLFDFATFEKFLSPPAAADIVKRDLDGTPVAIVSDPFVALRGLLEMYKHAA